MRKKKSRAQGEGQRQRILSIGADISISRPQDHDLSLNQVRPLTDCMTQVPHKFSNFEARYKCFFSVWKREVNKHAVLETGRNEKTSTGLFCWVHYRVPTNLSSYLS